MLEERQQGCDGCTGCRMRCTDGIKISRAEYDRIIEELYHQPLSQVHRILQQDKVRPWFEENTYTACLFLDLDTGLCLIYPARPLICRLFGRVTHLPCPEGKVPADLDAYDGIHEYYRRRRATFQEWMQADGFRNLDSLLNRG